MNNYCRSIGCTSVSVLATDFCVDCAAVTADSTQSDNATDTKGTNPLSYAIKLKDFPELGYVSGNKASNPKDSIGSSKLPLHLVPDTLMIFAAMAFAEGDSKYIGYNFRVAGVRATVYIAAMRRHLMRYVNGEWADKKTGVPHLASVVACASILIDGHVLGNIVDDRPPGVDLSDCMEEAERIIAHVYKMNASVRAAAPVQQYTAESTGTTLERVSI